MLLRLLPNPSAAQPAPPTILFTLPLPTHPYTSRSLPLPSNLLAHKTVCLHEDIDCSNVLLGEKSTWISGIIDDVTFSLPLSTVRIHFIDGSATTLTLSEQCAQALLRVVDQVNRSFAPVCPTRRSTTSSNASSPTPSSSSRASSPTNPSPRRSTSALLLTLLSPLLPGTQSQLPRSQANDPQHVSRMHRRQARSQLVDAYRQFVLPELKAALPTAYLPWAIASEVTQRTAEYESVKVEINSILASTGYDASTRQPYTPTKRARSLTSSTMSSSEGSESDSSDIIDTPLTSAQSSRCSSPLSRMLTASPHSFILSIPPAHHLPSAYRSTYSHRLADLTRIASRLSAIKKLDMQYDREENKRKWLENIERGKAGERALRRAWSIGESHSKGVSSYARPVRSSPLWRSWTAEDEERSANLALAMPIAIHPAMMDDDSDSSSLADSDSVSSSDEICLVTPPHSISYGPLGRRDSMTPPTPVRPPLVSRKAVPTDDNAELDSTEHLVAPPLMPSKSDDSLPEVEEWDHDSAASPTEENQPVRIVDPPSKATWAKASTPLPLPAPSSITNFKSKIVNWARLEPDDHDAEFPLVF